MQTVSVVISSPLRGLGSKHRSKMDAQPPPAPLQSRHERQLRSFKAGSQGDATAVTQAASQQCFCSRAQINMMSVAPAWFKGEPAKDRLSHADVQYAAAPRVPYLTKKSGSDETLGKSAERERQRQIKLV